MDKQILNSLNKGEHLVEMQEYILQYQTVYKVIVYTCIGKTLFKNSRIDTFEFPFYFKTKSIAEEFLKYWDELWLSHTTYWDHSKDNHCFGLYVKDHDNNVYTLVDAFKLDDANAYNNKCQLTYDGVWGGTICNDGRYYTYSPHNFYFTRIFNLENIAQKVNKNPYVFKMIKDQVQN